MNYKHRAYTHKCTRAYRHTCVMHTDIIFIHAIIHANVRLAQGRCKKSLTESVTGEQL